jgi:hypothetical protein
VTADGTFPRAAAAALKLPLRAMASSTLMASSESIRRSMFK